MTRLSDLFRNMFRRAATKPRPAVANRTRLGILALEDRVVPAFATIGLTAINDAAEGGTDGVFEITREGNTSGSLTVNYSVGGTATSGDDYTALSGSVSFASGVATATVDVHAIHDGIIDPDETVSITITSGTGYIIGAEYTAELDLIDTDILPVAFDSLVTTSMNEPVIVEVLDFSSSLWDDTLTTASVTQGEEGTVLVNQDGTVTYMPDTDFYGEDSFTYTVEDPFGNESTGTITVTVTHPLAPPTSVWTATDTAVTVAIPDLAYDPDGQTLTTLSVTQGLHGGVVLNQDGTATYTPGTSFTGDDSFAYTVEDPDGNQATGVITVSVGAVDPIAMDDEVATAVNAAVVIDSVGVAFDPAGDTLVVVAVSQGSHGSVVNNQDGTFTYTPSTSFTGTDTFTYTVEDDDSNSSIGTITVVVGQPAATEADGFVDDLEGLEEQIEDYDEDTPDAILEALPGITNAITNYLSEAAETVSANSLDRPGLNHSFKQFTEEERSSVTTIFTIYTNVLKLEAQQWNATLANSSLIKVLRLAMISAENAAIPDGVLIHTLDQMILSSFQNHKVFITEYIRSRKITEIVWDDAFDAWRSLSTVVPSLAPPQLPPVRNLKLLYPVP